MLLLILEQVMLLRVYFEMLHGTFLLFYIHIEQFSLISVRRFILLLLLRRLIPICPRNWYRVPAIYIQVFLGLCRFELNRCLLIWKNKIQVHLVWLYCCIAVIHIQPYTYTPVAFPYTCSCSIHTDAMNNRRTQTSLQIYLSLALLLGFEKGYSRFACERELETEQKL